MTATVKPGPLLALVVLVNMLNTGDRHIINALLEPIKHEFQLSDSQLGVISGLAYSIAALTVAIPAGMLADRFSRKTVLSLALGLWSAFTALCGVATGYVTLVLGRMGVGAAESAGSPACLSMIADTFPKTKQAGATGIYYAAGTIGASLAFWAGTWLAQHFDWRWAFYAAAAPALIVIPLLMIFLVEPARGGTAEAADKAGLREAIAVLIRTPRLALIIIAASLSPIGSIALLGWGTSLLVRNHGMELTDAGLVIAVTTGVFTSLGQFLGGRVGDKLAAKRAGSQLWFAGAGCLAGGVFGIVAALSPITAVAVAAIFCAATCFLLYLGSAFALVMQFTPPRSRATIFALVTVLGGLFGTGIPPVLVGRISDAIGGPHSLSPAIAIVMLVQIVPVTIYLLLGSRIAAAAKA